MIDQGPFAGLVLAPDFDAVLLDEQKVFEQDFKVVVVHIASLELDLASCLAKKQLTEGRKRVAVVVKLLRQLTSRARLPDLDDIVGSKVLFGRKEGIAAVQAEIVTAIKESNGGGRFLAKLNGTGKNYQHPALLAKLAVSGTYLWQFLESVNKVLVRHGLCNRSTRLESNKSNSSDAIRRTC